MEHEIIGHGRKIIKLTRDKKQPILHKVREIAIEIFIIVFAISLAAYVERYREHAHEEAEARECLLGIRHDLKLDLIEIQEDRAAYRKIQGFMGRVRDLPPGQLIPLDTIMAYKESLYVPWQFVPNDAHFDGFKTSGKLGAITDEKLQAEVVLLYQSRIPWLIGTQQYSHKHHASLIALLAEKGSRSANGKLNYDSLLASDQAKLISEIAYWVDSRVVEHYTNLEAKANDIIKMIDAKYGAEEEEKAH